ncbi:hypothetical protein IIA16_00545 [bacterium]|nr:hypothetical protein [bacterium]
MKVKHFFEIGRGYNTPPLEETMNKWFAAEGQGVKVVEIMYSASVSASASVELDADNSISIASALVLYEEA